ncbi:MAG: hypothetical protein DBY32_10065 [Phascolarctobacterium sp.]|nr:MAG: hypothetical protein DBY32_10065 [Phascolarctobacterium sp.]
MKIKISTIKKVIGILFFTLFAAFLVYPNSGLPRSEENAKIVARENRKITPRPTQSLKNKEFYTQFEKWYQDRLRKRDKAIKYWKGVNFAMGIVLSDSLVLGTDNWLLNKSSCINNFNTPTEKMAKIKALQDYCHKNGKDFIIIVAPNKESIYRDYFPAEIQAKYKAPEYWHKQAENLFKANGINYLSVAEQIKTQRQNNTDDLYFPDDHHWSYYGSSIAADLLLNKLENDLQQDFYKGLKFDGTTITASKEHSYASQLGIFYSSKTEAPWSKEYTDEIYLTDCYTGKTSKAKKVVSNDSLWGPIVKGEGIVTNKTANNDIKLLILGDSYSSYMVPYLSQNVKQIVSTHYRDCAEKKKEINMPKLLKKYDPNAVVLIMVEGGFFHSKSDNLFKNLKF